MAPRLNASQPCRAPRYPFCTALEIEWGSSLLQGRVCDISAEGMFIEIASPLWVGASFSAQLSLVKPLRVDCTVHRVEPGRGMGVRIVVTDEESRKRFTGLLKALARK